MKNFAFRIVLVCMLCKSDPPCSSQSAILQRADINSVAFYRPIDYHPSTDISYHATYRMTGAYEE